MKSTALQGDALKGKENRITGRSIWSAGFHMYVVWATARLIGSGGQPDALLATERKMLADSHRTKGSLV